MEEISRAEKLRIAGIKKHGSEEKWREFQRQSANKSSRNSKGTGGFAYLKANDPERLKEISRLGGTSGRNIKELET